MARESLSAHATPSATELRRQLGAGTATAPALLEPYLERVALVEPTVNAFAYFDPELPRDAAKRVNADDRQTLAGIPIGVKDIIDTAAMPTRFNSPLYDDRQPAQDAAVVAALRSLGAVVLGKTTTVEFAALGRVPKTVNPHNPAHTPGGSSCGSAAAVAAGMVPIALATQTGGSTIRPASFCGVAAIKPTFGVVPIGGVRPYAPSLDTVGWMANTVDDLALVARALRVCLGAERPDRQSTIGFYRSPYWRDADADTRAALNTCRDKLTAAGIDVVDVDGPTDAERLNEAQDIVMHGEGRVAFVAESVRARGALHAQIIAEVDNAKGIDRDQLRWAYDYLAAQRGRFDAALAAHAAWLTPAVPGEAPLGLAATGNAVFNRLWSALHVPCITLPGFRGANDLPVGIQLVARRFDDDALLRVAARVERVLHQD